MAASAVIGEDADVLYDRPFQILLVANVVGPMGPAVVSPALDSLIGVFGVTEASIGLLVTAYFVPTIFAIPVAGLLADRIGRKPVLAAGLILIGIGGIAIPLTTDFRVVLGLRLVQGIGGAGVAPIIVTSIGDLYDGARESTAQGLRNTTSGVAQAAFPALAGFLVVVAWQYPFLLYGLALPIGVLVAVGLVEPMDETGSRESSTATHVRELVGLAIQRRILPLVVAYTVPAFLQFAFIAYVSIVIVRVLGSTPGTAGLVVSLAGAIIAVAATQAGRVTAAFETRTVPLVFATAAMAVGLVGFAVIPSVPGVTAAAALIAVGFGLVQPLLRSEVTAAAPETLRGGLVSVAESLARVGAAAGPAVVGAGIAVLQPAVGFEAALRWSLVGLAVVSGLVGAAGVVLAARAKDA